ALSIDPSSADAIEGQIALDLAKQNRTAARELIENRLRQAPRDGQMWFLAAQVYATAGDQQRATDALRRTIDLSPSNLRAFAMLGQIYGAQGKLREARQQFETWIAREPKSIPAHTMVALLFERENDASSARKEYEKTLTIDPHAAVAANNLAWMYVDAGEKLDQAQQLAESAVAQLPEVADFNDTLGWIYYKKELPAQARPYIEKAVTKEGNNPLFHYHLGMVFAKQGEDSRAIQTLKHALSLSSSFPGAADAKRTLSDLTIQ
ncbi:MAG TPA: tetratricopeptide repeat protein, partial [Vicinamibacterales bacterium]|nr:tetratricopeptide repeat protein [Vicinamibacterales bacterium]